MGIRGVELKSSDIITAIYKHRGILRYAALELGCDHTTIYLHMDKYPEVAEAVEKARLLKQRDDQDHNKVLLEKARKSAEALLDEKDTTMTIFSLKALAGLTDKPQEIAPPININIITQPFSDNERSEHTTQVPLQILPEGSVDKAL